jgi:P4 family phage/plasmid primase-like protien
MDFQLIKKLADAGVSFVNTEPGKSWSKQYGWQTKATTDLRRLAKWVNLGWSLVSVSKRDDAFLIDRDDKQACASKGFKEEWLEALWGVDSPSGGDHSYGLQGEGFKSLPNVIKVQEVKGAKAGEPGSKLILEIKIHNHTCAAPTVERKGVKGKVDGMYQPKAPFAGLKRVDLPPDMLGWLKEHAESSEVSASHGEFDGWHPTFDKEEFLEAERASEQCSCMVDGCFHLVIEECQHCGRSKSSTVRGGLTKYIFSGKGNNPGFCCHGCGVNTWEDHVRLMQEEFPDYEPYPFFIYADHDDQLLLKNPKFEVQDADGSAKTGRDLATCHGSDGTSAPEEESTDAIAKFLNSLPPLPDFMDVGDESEIKRTDMGNGKRLARFCGYEIAYVRETEHWHVWDGKVWVEDRGNVLITRKAKEVVNSIFMEAAAARTEEEQKALANWAIISQSKARIEAMIALAKSEGTIAKSINDFNKDAHFFNCQNGVIDLRTGELLPHDPRYLMSQISPFKFLGLNAVPNLFTKYLCRVQADPNIRAFLQRCAGYSMWGTSREHAILFLWGTGNNGKGVLLIVLQKVLGGYCKPAEYKTFAETNKSGGPGGHSDDLAHLAGKRCVYVDETNSGGRLNEGLVKTVTGGGTQHASFKGKTGFDFDPIFTFWFASNHKPKLTDTGKSMRRRIKLIKFGVDIPDEEIDTSLPDKLVAEEGDLILSWMVKGAVEWYQKGLAAPKEVEEWTDQYFSDEDVIQHWLNECVELGSYESPARETYISFVQFAEGNNYPKLDAREFKKRLEQKGFVQKPKKDRNYWLDFKVTRHFLEEETICTDEMLEAIS